ncbi:hypothetical protein [Robiginitalea sp. IMCC43444]|uniref:hypothetical protein n=1 Tax=Robiginitalea sp. IMCC43444 TaxID=3459121 RepID=UPI004042B511
MPRPDTTDALIVLYVDTVGIQQYIDNPADPKVLEHVFISSNWTDSDSPNQTLTGQGGKTTFQTDIQRNSQLAWMGAAQDIANNQDHYVLITGIEMYPNQDPIGITLRNRETGSGNTHIDGFVSGGNKGITSYKINFSVGVADQIVGDFYVDPQLRMK